MTSTTLDRLSIASPCTADWSKMQGDAKSRFCAQCKLHVHDLSAMTTDEAEAKLRDAGQGRLCVRFFRRADGTVLTQDCPVGWKRRVRRAWARAAALTVALVGNLLGGLTGCSPRRAGSTAVPPTGIPTTPEAGGVRMGEAEMGDMIRPTQGRVMGIAAPDPGPTSQPQTSQTPPR